MKLRPLMKRLLMMSSQVQRLQEAALQEKQRLEKELCSAQEEVKTQPDVLKQKVCRSS